MNVENIFIDQFDLTPLSIASASGRVNLIGEHLDYNGGTVLPVAIDRQVHIAMRANDSLNDQIYSDTFNDTIVREANTDKLDHWSDYVAGALNKCRELGLVEGGFRVAIQSNVPHGGGVSSSTAVIIATIRAALKTAEKVSSDIDIAKWAQLVEQDYIGMPCGIMDQMVISIAAPKQAIALETASLEYSLVELPDQYHFAVVNSGIVRALNDGRYKVRRDECESASEALGVEYLCLMTQAEYARYEQLPLILQKRVRHAYTEQQRVVNAIDAFHASDIEKVGQLMNESHASMRDDFEVSTPEIDAMVESSKEFGALGARLTGGGFGGCIVACVAESILDEWRTNMESQYPRSEFIC